jgi:hypothetical protein
MKKLIAFAFAALCMASAAFDSGDPFAPSVSNSFNITVTASAQTLQVGSIQTFGNAQYRLTNVGTTTIFVTLGPSGACVAATTSNGMAIVSNTSIIVSSYPNACIGVIGAATGSTLYVTNGIGR